MGNNPIEGKEKATLAQIKVTVAREGKEEAKKKAILALKELNVALNVAMDAAVRLSASQDEPSVTWDYQQAEKDKAILNGFIEKIKAI